MTNAELIIELQNQGYGSGLTAAQWTQAAVDAVRMYSRQRPRYVLGTFDTAANVEEYSLPAGGHICLEVAPYDALDDLEDTFGATAALSEALAGGDVIVDFHQPSQVDIYRQKLEAWNRQWGSRWDQEAPGAAIRLMPRPDSIVTLAVLYTRPHDDASTVPDADDDLLGMAGRAVATQTLAIGAAVTVVGSGGRLTLGPYTRDLRGMGEAAKVLLAEAARLEDDFLDAARLTPAAQKE